MAIGRKATDRIRDTFQSRISGCSIVFQRNVCELNIFPKYCKHIMVFICCSTVQKSYFDNSTLYNSTLTHQFCIHLISFCNTCFFFLFFSSGVFGVADEVKSVSVMKGDSVTLNTDLTDKQKDDEILWNFEGSSIARINKEDKIFSTFDVDERFGDRLKLDKKTGSLTITNIRPEHHGLYQLDISGEYEAVKKFIVTVRGE